MADEGSSQHDQDAGGPGEGDVDTSALGNLQNYINYYLGNSELVCPLCKNTQWTVIDGWVNLSVLELSSGPIDTSITNSEKKAPLSLLCCINCGVTLLINLIAAHIITVDKVSVDLSIWESEMSDLG